MVEGTTLSAWEPEQWCEAFELDVHLFTHLFIEQMSWNFDFVIGTVPSAGMQQ